MEIRITTDMGSMGNADAADRARFQDILVEDVLRAYPEAEVSHRFAVALCTTVRVDDVEDDADTDAIEQTVCELSERAWSRLLAG